MQRSIDDGPALYVVRDPDEVARSVRTRRRLVEVRLTAIAGLYPYGGITRSFQLTEAGVAALCAEAARLEREARQ